MTPVMLEKIRESGNRPAGHVEVWLDSERRCTDWYCVEIHILKSNPIPSLACLFDLDVIVVSESKTDRLRKLVAAIAEVKPNQLIVSVLDQRNSWVFISNGKLVHQ